MRIVRCDLCKKTNEKEVLEIINYTMQFDSTEEIHGIISTVCKVDLCETCFETFKDKAREFCLEEFADVV